jgi:hypothetical protein
LERSGFSSSLQICAAALFIRQSALSSFAEGVSVESRPVGGYLMQICCPLVRKCRVRVRRLHSLKPLSLPRSICPRPYQGSSA